METRAHRAGRLLGTALVEAVNLMYQNKTIAHFYRGLLLPLTKEVQRRELILIEEEANENCKAK